MILQNESKHRTSKIDKHGWGQNDNWRRMAGGKRFDSQNYCQKSFDMKEDGFFSEKNELNALTYKSEW